ncbi:hypothetical protein C8R45DRAFT_570630 [Mycena sanguinolenta]|nr:hypothetical protein C8R45DRAFT_570630 [Mycena sanguinolenta]
MPCPHRRSSPLSTLEACPSRLAWPARLGRLRGAAEDGTGWIAPALGLHSRRGLWTSISRAHASDYSSSSAFYPPSSLVSSSQAPRLPLLAHSHDIPVIFSMSPGLFDSLPALAVDGPSSRPARRLITQRSACIRPIPHRTRLCDHSTALPPPLRHQSLASA